MSVKRTSSKPRNVKKRNEGADLFQQDDNAKRAKLISLTDTTLQDLPIELIECILIEVIAMEVEGMMLAKTVWKEKAELVINRLRTVCSQWNSLLTSTYFRNKLHRTLDGTAQVKISLEILHQCHLMSSFIKLVTIIKDEIFVIGDPQNGAFRISVCDSNYPYHVKDVIPLPEIYPECMAACVVSNCVYILYRKRRSHIRILRITRVGEHLFNITPFLTDVWMPNPRPTLSVSASGSLIFSRQQKNELPVISIYNADGSVQHQIRMYADIPKFYDIIPRSNGNLVLVSANDQRQAILTEIDMDVTIIRQYQSSFQADMCALINQADDCGRILVSDGLKRIELLDAEFNLLDISGRPLDDGAFISKQKLIYNRERNEALSITCASGRPVVLTIFRFREE